MFKIRLSAALGKTEADFTHPVGFELHFDKSRDKLVSEAEILDGPFEGELERRVFLGSFNQDATRGKIDEIRSVVSGDIHYAMIFDEPIALHRFATTFNAALASGIDFRGNGSANVILGDAGADLLDGRGGRDTLRGFDGDDELIGGTGDDELRAAAGDDRLVGGDGEDELFGGSGDDRLIGGAGKDVLEGNGGADQFQFRSPEDLGLSVTRCDVIRNFEAGKDRIDLRNVDAALDATGDQAFAFIGDAAFSGVSGELRYRGGFVAGDLDGDAKADFRLAIDNDADLTLTDFLL